MNVDEIIFDMALNAAGNPELTSNLRFVIRAAVAARAAHLGIPVPEYDIKISIGPWHSWERCVY